MGKKKQQIYTQYMADFPLWVVARAHRHGGGSTETETAWLKSDEMEGPALFVSALDAEIYCRNRLQFESDWRRVALEQIDLAEIVRNMNGGLHCQMVFGFSATVNGELALHDGHLRPMFVPLHFELSTQGDAPVIFSFNDWVFDFIRDQWRTIGATEYLEQLERFNESDDHTIAQEADAAWRCAVTAAVQQSHAEWGVYLPGTNTWKYGPTESRQQNNLH